MHWNRCIRRKKFQAIQQLPDDLKKTYQRSFSKLTQHDQKRSLAVKTLQFIYGAQQPLTISQLQEALMIDPQTGELKGNRVHRDEILSCSVSFIYLERNDSDSENDLVLLAHHSVRQFLMSIIISKAPDSELGELCIAHLFYHMPRVQLTKYNESQASNMQNRISIPVQSNIASTIAGLSRFGRFVRPLVNQPIRSTFPSIKLPTPSNRIINGFGVNTFLYYAKENWLLLSRRIASYPSFTSFSKFRILALLNNDFWWIYPWTQSQPRSSSTKHLTDIYQ